ncbi:MULTISPECIES: LysR family transcriptional regulator [unclassified Bosea (in: a-proteobacteria)]|uniref:LysR family transcriptional regulator n=1 Tax=unclassified Bosea (in: a-proteobacteria) TaxID=2653178 RepID=UPI000F7E457C|nr:MULTISPECIES: LysR family transcriptional regulator [unclassified Bosea (in: a-proteobacteria)]RXT26001.1 hypothetical protein B5U98_05460 [Bosea sp. Tri-39]RXT31243.1 hypothetical protein B5U99_21005 [Bosea sp. Tri-54]
MLTFRQIEVFRAVMACGSLAGAARELRIAQPTVTRMILRMEDQLGARLFNRVRGRLTPTQEASRFLAEIDRAFEQMRSAVERAAQAALPERAVFRCGASPSIGRGLVPAALARLLARMPAVSLQLDILTVSQVLPYLLDGSADAAVTLFPVMHHEVVSTAVGSGRPVLLMPAGMGDVPPAKQTLPASPTRPGSSSSRAPSMATWRPASCRIMACGRPGRIWCASPRRRSRWSRPGSASASSTNFRRAPPTCRVCAACRCRRAGATRPICIARSQRVAR